MWTGEEAGGWPVSGGQGSTCGGGTVPAVKIDGRRRAAAPRRQPPGRYPAAATFTPPRPCRTALQPPSTSTVLHGSRDTRQLPAAEHLLL